jgi:sterol desaturase/sphingolipid hydroxylase (fatty acid hydroxylase superfamily)
VSAVPHEPAIRFGCFATVLLIMACWEGLAPCRRPAVARPVRWFSNLGLVALDTLAVRFLAPLGALGVAFLGQQRGWGLLNSVTLPGWLGIVLAVVALDFAIYLQHVLFHAVPLLWWMHRVHHADLDFDATTGVRFHPLEILLSLGIKMGAVALLGAPPVAVLVFEVLLNASSVFSHGNVRLPAGFDRVLRWLVVTPEMHRVHHSAVPRETNSNFGFNLPWWDYLFGTYRGQPAAGHEQMTVGLDWPRDERLAERLHWLLLLPFLGRPGDYPINRRGGPKDERSDAAPGRASAVPGQPIPPGHDRFP